LAKSALRLAAPSRFVVFIIYEAAAMLFSLVAYVQVARARPASGAPCTVAGLLVTIAAAVVQASPTSLAPIVPFDHNGLYHVVQLLGVVLLLLGLRQSLLGRVAHRAPALHPVGA
jgi:hypothetical protein